MRIKTTTTITKAETNNDNNKKNIKKIKCDLPDYIINTQQ